ncbi:hypothetical protein QTO34_016846 [Cnephaeus nilssonii]|uniref:Uncharacterized protein n=1 Tax=Cnephaeus nilssonii TaxID=3371016 RepID=A0AA40I2Z9_CNENI|nr:hypothetical protein QTO34_016846 [Eptesicus nilssonii]
MTQTLSSRRHWRRELSVLLAQSATPATLSPAPCASCWPNRGDWLIREGTTPITLLLLPLLATSATKLPRTLQVAYRSLANERSEKVFPLQLTHRGGTAVCHGLIAHNCPPLLAILWWPSCVQMGVAIFGHMGAAILDDWASSCLLHLLPAMAPLSPTISGAGAMRNRDLQQQLAGDVLHLISRFLTTDFKKRSLSTPLPASAQALLWTVSPNSEPETEASNKTPSAAATSNVQNFVHQASILLNKGYYANKHHSATPTIGLAGGWGAGLRVAYPAVVEKIKMAAPSLLRSVAGVSSLSAGAAKLDPPPEGFLIRPQTQQSEPGQQGMEASSAAGKPQALQTEPGQQGMGSSLMAMKAKKEAPAPSQVEATAKVLKAKKVKKEGNATLEAASISSEKSPRRHKHDHGTILKFSLTAKSAMKRTEDNSSHVFTVDANKHQMKPAVKKLYDIDVTKEAASKMTPNEPHLMPLCNLLSFKGLIRPQVPSFAGLVPPNCPSLLAILWQPSCVHLGTAIFDYIGAAILGPVHDLIMHLVHQLAVCPLVPQAFRKASAAGQRLSKGALCRPQTRQTAPPLWLLIAGEPAGCLSVGAPGLPKASGAAMTQTLSSRRQWRRELSVLLAQSATRPP